MLEIDAVSARYARARVLDGVTFAVPDGQVVSVVGANGAGKSTLVKDISGLLRPSGGRVKLDGEDITQLPAHEIVRRGIVHVPEGRRLFGDMTVEENLLIGSTHAGARPARAESLNRVQALFPILRERASQLARTLSGGEQQMLAIARVLRAGPTLLLLDEPSEGLAPVVVQQIQKILRGLKSEGMSMLLVEQNLHFALSLADRHTLIVDGEVKETLTTAQVRARDRELLEHLSV